MDHDNDRTHEEEDLSKDDSIDNEDDHGVKEEDLIKVEANADSDFSIDDCESNKENHVKNDNNHDSSEDSRYCTNTKRKNQPSQKSGPVVGSPKTPRLDPANYFWNGKTGSLKEHIDKWKELLNQVNYSPASGVNFILSCIPGNKQHLVSDCTTADEALLELGLYATETTAHPTNIIETMKAHSVCTTHKDSTFILDFATAQQLCRKFSTITMRTKYMRILLKFTDSTSDEHGINVLS